MPQTKKKTTTRRKSNASRKNTKRKKQNESPLRYIIAIAIVILVVLGAFQLGIVGQMIDSFFNYLFGMSRFLTYILVILGTVFITYSKKIPKTRRSVGALVLQIALLCITQLYTILVRAFPLKENQYYLMFISHTNILTFLILEEV